MDDDNCYSDVVKVQADADYDNECNPYNTEDDYDGKRNSFNILSKTIKIQNLDHDDRNLVMITLVISCFMAIEYSVKTNIENDKTDGFNDNANDHNINRINHSNTLIKFLIKL